MSTPATITIPEAAVLLGVGRNTLYEQARTGTIAGVPVIRVRGRLLIPRAPLLEVLGLSPENGSGRSVDRPDPPLDTKKVFE